MLPRVDLARTPTPVEPLARIGASLGVDLWIKRDDCTGLGLSGNKVRKLELLLADAAQRGANVVITCGGLQSNHCRATAIAARRLGMDAVLLLRGQRPAVLDGNLLLGFMVGADLRLCTADEYAHRDRIMGELAAEQTALGRTPYIIPEGGSNGLGSMAFVHAAKELAAQVQHDFDAIIVPVGSGGTLAGLALGPSPGRVLGVAVCDDRAHFLRRVHEISLGAELHGAPRLTPPGERWDVIEGYQGQGYGLADGGLWTLIRKVAREEGVLLDPSYTGKAFQALVGEVSARRLGGRILFWHTGGAFGLFGRGAEIEGA